MTDVEHDEQPSWRCVVLDRTRTVAQALERNPKAEIVVRLRAAEERSGALGFSEPDAIFSTVELRSLPRDLPLEQLSTPDYLDRVRRKVDVEQGTVFSLGDWTVHVTQTAVSVSHLAAGTDVVVRRRAALPGPPIPGGIDVSCATCQCRATVPAKIPRRCPCGNPPRDHELAYGP